MKALIRVSYPKHFVILKIKMSDILYITDSAPIPEIFYSEKKNRPFENCTRCDKKLGKNDEIYLIEKAYERNRVTHDPELVFEVAYCFDCREGLMQSLSKTSRKKLEAYFKAHTDLDKRDAELKKYDLMDPDIWINNCIVKNKPIDQAKVFQLYAICWKNELVFHNSPYMICGEAMDEIVELLSNKSLDILNDFLTDLLDMPPEVMEIFRTRKPVLI